MEENKEKKSNIKDIVLKAFFIIAIIFIVFLLAFAVIRFVPFVFSSFANVGDLIKKPFANNKLEIASNKTEVDSGEKFEITWGYKPENAGVYKVRYECVDDLELYIFEGNEKKLLICNSAVSFNPAISKIQLQADLNKENTLVDLPIEISFLNNETNKVDDEGKVSVSVINDTTRGAGDLAGATIIKENISENTSGVENRNASVISGPTDLAISNLIAIDDAVVSFTVSNIGGSNSGNWFFRYDIPGEGSEISPLQLSLAPGTAIRYTLRFDKSDDGNAVISVDPSNLIRESNESNNVASVRVNGGENNNGSGGSVNYDRNDDADFDIRDLEVGRMDGSRFVEDDDIDDNDDAAIRFTVANIGGEDTDDWRFEINETPYDGSNNDYRSKRYDALRPGESIEVIVEFENPDEGRYDIEVEIDSDDDTDEENERNNKESEELRVRG